MFVPQSEVLCVARYMSIVRKERLEISQPALDRTKSEVHHQITLRGNRILHRY